jgi:hypothetical protein
MRDASDPMVGAAQDSDGNVLDPAVYTRKVNGIRLLLIGRVRGIDIDEHPPPGTIPVSQRPENAGRTWRGRTRHSAVLADEG